MVDENKIILSDVDDVLWDLIPAWVHWLDERHGLKVKVEDCNTWDIEQLFPTLSGEQLFEPLFLNSFWRKVKPRKDAMEYIPKLQSLGFKVVLCTATNFRHADKKFDYLLEYFPTIKDEDIILTADKSLVRGKYLVDDRWQNLTERECPILMSTWHNRSVSARKNGIKAKDWKEIYEFILKNEGITEE